MVGIRFLQAMEKMGLVVRGKTKRMLMVVHQQDGVKLVGGKVELGVIRSLLGAAKAIGTQEMVLAGVTIVMTLLVTVEEVEVGEEAEVGEVTVVVSEVEVDRIVVVLEVEVALAGDGLEVEEDLTGEGLVVEVDLKGRDFMVGVVLEAEDVVIGITEVMIQMWINPIAGIKVQTMMLRDGKVLAVGAVGTRETVTTICIRVGVHQKVMRPRGAVGTEQTVTTISIRVGTQVGINQKGMHRVQ